MGIINYCYFVVDEESGQSALIDASWNIKAVEQAIHKYGAQLSAVLLTHSHYDHTNLAQKLARKYNSNVYMSETEIQTYDFECPNLIAVSDGQSITIGNTTIECILTPGHTAGGMCYKIGDCLFTGDTIFIEGCGMCEDKGASPYDMFQSIRRIRTTIAPETKIYPAHSYGKNPGYPLTYLMSNNIYFQIDKIETFIGFRKRKGQKGIFDFK